MSQHFKSKYDQMRENGSATASKSDNENIGENGPVRNICFVLEDGSMTFLNYGYLMSGRIDAAQEKVILSFTSHEVEITGTKLKNVFSSLLTHTIQNIAVTGERYVSLQSENYVIIEIGIIKV